MTVVFFAALWAVFLYSENFRIARGPESIALGPFVYP